MTNLERSRVTGLEPAISSLFTTAPVAPFQASTRKQAMHGAQAWTILAFSSMTNTPDPKHLARTIVHLGAADCVALEAISPLKLPSLSLSAFTSARADKVSEARNVPYVRDRDRRLPM